MPTSNLKPTKKLYLNPQPQLNFQATVLACVPADPKEGLWSITLDQTAFYPEGGGQPGDRGTLEVGSQITSVFDTQLNQEDQTIYHITPHPLEVGTLVKAQVDQGRRQDFTTAHSGQHILSAILDKHYKTATVGFHLTEDNLTIDTDTLLSEADWTTIEAQCQDLIWSNLRLSIHYPKPQDLAQYHLRKVPKVTENIRLVALDNPDGTIFDAVPCGGTHVQRTGEVGLLKILKVDKYKTGQRISFCCHNRALKAMQLESRVIKQLNQHLSTQTPQVSDAVLSLTQRCAYLLRENGLLHSAGAAKLAKDLIAQAPQVTPPGAKSPIPLLALWVDDTEGPYGDYEGFKRLIQALQDENRALAFMAYGCEGLQQLTIITGPYPKEGGLNAKEILIELQKSFALKGGGSPSKVQAAAATQEDLLGAYKALVARYS